ncbi:3-phosphoserine/phosphohydroxythreonine transaminase [Allohahella sp. A8]|uniref:3-phosphoserine/phosphohydroxythreonine transaminase n=1 Tax=Allohahella sp. A8 TaxID=3141461 RepID=UPI003A806D5B
MRSQTYNFCSGPATLPTAVLNKAQAELLDWHKMGVSIMEISHRSPEFTAVAKKAEQSLRQLMSIPDDYAVLFMQGGATQQFSGVPMNFFGLCEGKQAGYVDTGIWSRKALEEAGRYVDARCVASSKDSNYTRLPASWSLDDKLAYVHYTPNETIGGVEFPHIPDVGDIPLVADMSSTILSRPIDVSKFALIYAGAQKNIGPAGLTLVIVRRDLLASSQHPALPPTMNFRLFDENDSMLNTPPTFGWYLAGLIFDWLIEAGGLTAMGEVNSRKSARLYSYLDASDFYHNPIHTEARSWMNVPFVLKDESRNGAFLKFAEAHGLLNLKGHRSVGGMRASLYNAMPEAGVDALIDVLTKFAES